jgi:hypothetical protein
MGFNFGAFLGGAASQITKDIDEEQDRVKLRMDKILDKQQDLTIQNQKEYKAKKEKVTNQLNALVPLFGDDPQALAKARSIVAGGDNHFNFMFNKLEQASSAGQNINEIYGLIPNKDAVGFESVEDATDSLVKIAELPEIKISESSGMAKLFGIDQKAYYNKERKVLEEVGQIQSATAGVPEKGAFAQGKLDLSKMKKVFKSADEFEANLLNDVNKFEVGTKEHDAASKKYEDFRIRKAKTSAGYITEELRQKNEKNKNAITYGYVQKGWLEGVNNIKDNYDDRIEVGGKILLKGSDEYKNHVNKEIYEYNKSFVQNILDDVEGGNLRTNGIKLIQSTVELKEIANQIQKDKLKGGKEDKDKDKSFFQKEQEILSKKRKEENLNKNRSEFKKKYGDDLSKAAEDLFKRKDNKGKKYKKEDVFNTLKNLYPDKSEKEIFDIVSQAEDSPSTKKEKVIGEKVKARPDDGSFFDSPAEDEWDRLYGKTHFRDGRPKPPKKLNRRGN